MAPPAPLTALLVSIVALAGCSSQCSLRAPFRRPPGEARDFWVRTFPVIGGARLEVTGITGDIDVRVGGAQAIEVEAERIVRAVTREAAAAILQGTTIRESATLLAVSIETPPPKESQPGADQRVRYRITVPASTSVDLRTMNGRIVVSGISGTVQAMTTDGDIVGRGLTGGVRAESVNGALSIDLAGFADDLVTLDTENGAIGFSLPRRAQATLSALALRGRILVSSSLAIGESGRNGRRLDADLNGGGTLIRIRSGAGDIRISGR